MPHHRRPEPDEPAVELPGGFSAPASQAAFVRSELERVRSALEALTDLVEEVRWRVKENRGVLAPDAARAFWINPVADLRVMNLLEDSGGRLAGTEFLFSHALDLIPEDLPPMEALARMALADPVRPTLRAQLEALVETVLERRRR